MEHVNTGIHRFNGRVGLAAFHIPAYRVVTHFERNNLLEMEDILDDDDGAVCVVITMLVESLLFLSVAKLRDPHTNTELLMAVRAFEDQCLTIVVSCLVECDELVTLGASHSFHQPFTSIIHPASPSSANSLSLFAASWLSS